MKIYVQFEKPKTVKEFLIKFFSSDQGWNGSHAIPTFHDKECTKIQCHGGRNRSINDLYDCVKTYFSRVKLKTVLKILVQLRPNGNYFNPYYCPNIRRHVIAFHFYSSPFPSPNTRWGKLLNQAGIKRFYEKGIVYKTH